MKKSITSITSLAFLVGLQTTKADTFTLPALEAGPISVSEGSPVTVTFDLSSIEFPSTGPFTYSNTLNANWSDGGGFAWSSDVRASIDSNSPVSPSSGQLNSGADTNLQWDFDFSAYTEPVLEVILDQTTQRGSTGVFTDLNVVIDLGLPNTISAGESITTSYDGLVWYETPHNGGLFEINTNGSSFDTQIGLFDDLGDLVRSNDDGGTGLDSSIAMELVSGTYYVAFSQFFSSFSDGFMVSGNTSSSGGTLVINRLATSIPEPSSSALIGLSSLAFIFRRKR